MKCSYPHEDASNQSYSSQSTMTPSCQSYSSPSQTNAPAKPSWIWEKKPLCHFCRKKRTLECIHAGLHRSLYCPDRVLWPESPVSDGGQVQTNPGVLQALSCLYAIYHYAKPPSTTFSPLYSCLNWGDQVLFLIIPHHLPTPSAFQVNTTFLPEEVPPHPLCLLLVASSPRALFNLCLSSCHWQWTQTDVILRQVLNNE